MRTGGRDGIKYKNAARFIYTVCFSNTKKDGQSEDAMRPHAHSLQNGSVRVIDNGSTWKE